MNTTSKAIIIFLNEGVNAGSVFFNSSRPLYLATTKDLISDTNLKKLSPLLDLNSTFQHLFA